MKFFSEVDAVRLQKSLKFLYNIDTNLTCRINKNIFVGYRLSIGEANSKALRELIKPYLALCMSHKVSDGNKFHL